MAEINESELVAELRAGRSSAYAVLMRRNNQRLYRLARGVLGDDAEAEEAVQAGYVRAFTHIDSFKGEASIATWLARIVLNEAMTRQRRRRHTVDIDDVSEQTLNADAEPAAIATRREPSPEQALARREISRAIECAVDALPAAFRAVFILRAIEQLSIEETASSLGIPEETVKTRLHRANKLLRATLAQNFDAIFEDAFPFLGPRCDRLVATVLKRLNLPDPSAAVSDRRSLSHDPP
ncbi:MAG TPA: RNA polymerase sigma factor [Stellaceae bacterium]|nr:RNA polymerase sigma factor [Stellaceae bacterium]